MKRHETLFLVLRNDSSSEPDAPKSFLNPLAAGAAVNRRATKNGFFRSIYPTRRIELSLLTT